MSEQPGGDVSLSQADDDDQTVRVREQTANDLGDPDAFGSDDSASTDATGQDAPAG